MHDTKTLYRLAVQMHILHQEELGQAPPTIEEAKKAVEHLISSMNGIVVTESIVIHSGEAETEEVQLKKQGNNLNFTHLISDTGTGIIKEKTRINLPTKHFRSIAQTILDMA